MLLLISTTDILEVVTSAAATVDVVASYMDSDNANPPVVQGDTMNTQLTAITTATTTTVVSAPASNERRNVKTLHIRNKHASTATDVTVQFDRSGTNYELHKVNLLPGEALEYIEGVGFFKLESAAATGFQWVRNSSQDSNSTTSFADVAGMGFAIVANAVYEVEYDLIFRAAATTTGIGLSLNGPASPTSVNGTCMLIGHRGAATAGATASWGFTAYDTPTATSIAVEATATDYVARICAVIENGANAGTLIPRFKSEVAASAVTIEVGSFGTIKRLA